MSTPVGYRQELSVPPGEQTFTLPDHTPVRVIETEDSVRVYHVPARVHFLSFDIQLAQEPIRVSPQQVNEDRAVASSVLLVTIPVPGDITTRDVWTALYALWTRRAEHEALPVSFDKAVTNAPFIIEYLVHSGLALPVPGSETAGALLIIRSSFWQGAGASLSAHWLRSPVPNPNITLTPFPFFQSFTRGPHVLTTHPLRPPKPAPGTVIYSRFIFAVGEHLTFTHIDAKNPDHFDAYARWQNSERVNVGWRERGSDEKHHAYLADRLADPHIMGFIVSWNGEHAGYGEMSWTKEDPMGTYVGGLGDYDQGTHLLVGEERFRGRHRFTAIMTSMKHACFLREPRTDIVVGEPRADLPIIPRLIAYLPQELNREFELPHKRAVYFVLRRERFFQAAMLD